MDKKKSKQKACAHTHKLVLKMIEKVAIGFTELNVWKLKKASV